MRFKTKNDDCLLVFREEDRDLSKFMVVPTEEEERSCYEAFYDSTSNEAIRMEICPVCARQKLARDGKRTSLLSDESVMAVLGIVGEREGEESSERKILRDLLEVDEEI